MTNQLDINKFNSFLDKATKSILCGPECQKEQTTEELKKKLLNAKTNLILAEPQYNNAKKNYYTFVSGENGYDEIIEKEYTDTANNVILEYKTSLQDEINKIKTQLQTYNGILINFKNVEDLNNKYKKENVLLFKNLKEKSNDILTNERKTYYEDQEINSLTNFYSYVLIIIYIIVVIGFGAFSFIYPSNMNWKIRFILFIVFIILPYISTWILGKIIQVIYWLYSILPKNIYKNI